ncbi:hypothetical protein [Amycolatopsis sp. NPDC051716]|uniref:hypothetical protein n=1 Tax=Amycolatopsis sp. NPDC051716 TaxID=3155804 RepID=UPI00343587E9
MNATQTNGIRVTVIKPGDLVFLDSFSGLVPAKVTGYTSWGHITVVVTAERGAYRRGERTTFRPSGCVPRAHVRVRSGHYRIFGAWTFAELPDEFQPGWAWD